MVISMTGGNKIEKYKTTVHTDKKKKTKIAYYDTVIVRFTEDEIVLDTGGWWTRTTKGRMNQASRQFKVTTR